MIQILYVVDVLLSYYLFKIPRFFRSFLISYEKRYEIRKMWMLLAKYTFLAIAVKFVHVTAVNESSHFTTGVDTAGRNLIVSTDVSDFALLLKLKYFQLRASKIVYYMYIFDILNHTYIEKAL